LSAIAGTSFGWDDPDTSYREDVEAYLKSFFESVPAPSFASPKEALQGICDAISELTQDDPKWRRTITGLANEKNSLTWTPGQLALKNASVFNLQGAPTLFFAKDDPSGCWTIPLGPKAGQHVNSYLEHMERVDASIPKLSSAIYTPPRMQGLDID
jgi:hypothetical protein